MKQKNQTITKSFKALSLSQMFAVTGGEESNTASTAPPPVTAPEDTDPLATSISNVLKTKHDTAKNSVGNIR